jgi:hypothetical protein
MKMDHLYKKSYESRKYYVPDNVRKGSGALGNQTDKLKTRKLPGHIEKKEMIPHTRGH